MDRRGLAIRIIYAACLLAATVNRVRAVAARGWLSADVPAFTAIYWSSLTFLDPIAAILLFVRPRTGVALTAAIIVTDVVHNLWFTASYSQGGSLYDNVTASFALMSQLAFLLFVAATAPLAWRTSRKSS